MAAYGIHGCICGETKRSEVVTCDKITEEKVREIHWGFFFERSSVFIDV